jgi:hypothetical protein
VGGMSQRISEKMTVAFIGELKYALLRRIGQGREVQGAPAGGTTMTFTFQKRYDETIEGRMKEFFTTLSEKDQRRYAALEAAKLGHGGIAYVAQVVGCSRRTIARGEVELQALPQDPAAGRIRRPGAGRKKATEAQPELAQNFFPSSSRVRRATRCSPTSGGPI